jgi:hypothetical protein
MTKEEIIAGLERDIKGLEFALADPQVHPRENEQQHLDTALEEAKELLEQIKAGDEELIQEISHILDQAAKYQNILLKSNMAN